MICTCDHDFGDVCSVCAPEDPVIKAHIESGGLARDVALMQQWAAEIKAAQYSIFPFAPITEIMRFITFVAVIRVSME